MKDLGVLLCYHFGSEKFRAIPKKVELVEAVKYIFRKDWNGLAQIWGGWGVYSNKLRCSQSW